MIQKLLLNNQMIWMILIKIWKNANKKQQMLIVLDDMIDDMLSNKKPSAIVAEL